MEAIQYFAMPTKQYFVIDGGESLVKLAERGDFEKLDSVIENLKIRVVKTPEHLYTTIDMVARLRAALRAKNQIDRWPGYVAKLLSVAMAVEDYNLVHELDSVSYRNEESVDLLKRFWEYRTMAIEAWDEFRDELRPFEYFEQDLGDIKVYFQELALWFNYRGIDYRVYRFDN